MLARVHLAVVVGLGLGLGACAEPTTEPIGEPIGPLTESALGGGTVDAPPLPSPRIDEGFGASCWRSGHFTHVTPLTVLDDGTVLSCSNQGAIATIGTVQVCRPDGTSADYASGDTAWGCYPLRDRRVIIRHTWSAEVVSAQGVLATLANSTPFGRAWDLGDTIYLGFDGVVAYDSLTYAPRPAPAVAPPQPIASCPPATGSWVIVSAAGGITWGDPATGQPDPAHPIVPRAPYEKLLVDNDCSLVLVAPPGGSERTVRAYGADGTLTRAFPLGLAGETSMVLDHRGGLVLSFPHTPTADVRLARIELATGALDPAFGTDGIAELDWPSVAWSESADGSFTHDTATLAGADAAGNLAVRVEHFAYLAFPANVTFDGAAYARVLVDH